MVLDIRLSSANAALEKLIIATPGSLPGFNVVQRSEPEQQINQSTPSIDGRSWSALQTGPFLFSTE